MSENLTLPPKLIDIHNHLAADDPNGSKRSIRIGLWGERI
jgi:hypothetical protein